MATKEKEKKPAAKDGAGAAKGGGAKGGGAKGGGKGGRKGGGKADGRDAGAGLPIRGPRLKGFYNETVRPRLKQQFGFTNPHQVPQLEKIVINVGVGEAIKQPK